MSDPTVSWQEYLSAARALQTVRDQLAGQAAADTRAASSARAELAAVHTRLERQQALLCDDGGRLWNDPPDPAEVASLAGGGPTAVHAALRECQHLLDDVDAALAGRGRRVRRRWWRPWRWRARRRPVRSR